MSQPTLKFINHVSRAMGCVIRLKDRHDQGTVDFDVATLDSLALIQDQLKQALYGASDSLHLVSMDVSELERKRDDLYVQSASGNSKLKVARPSADPLRCEKDTSALDKLAAQERVRQKELATAQWETHESTVQPNPVERELPLKLTSRQPTSLYRLDFECCS